MADDNNSQNPNETQQQEAPMSSNSTTSLSASLGELIATKQRQKDEALAMLSATTPGPSSNGGRGLGPNPVEKIPKLRGNKGRTAILGSPKPSLRLVPIEEETPSVPDKQPDAVTEPVLTAADPVEPEPDTDKVELKDSSALSAATRVAAAIAIDNQMMGEDEATATSTPTTTTSEPPPAIQPTVVSEPVQPPINDQTVALIMDMLDRKNLMTKDELSDMLILTKEELAETLKQVIEHVLTCFSEVGLPAKAREELEGYLTSLNTATTNNGASAKQLQAAAERLENARPLLPAMLPPPKPSSVPPPPFPASVATAPIIGDLKNMAEEKADKKEESNRPRRPAGATWDHEQHNPDQHDLDQPRPFFSKNFMVIAAIVSLLGLLIFFAATDTGSNRKQPIKAPAVTTASAAATATPVPATCTVVTQDWINNQPWALTRKLADNDLARFKWDKDIVFGNLQTVVNGKMQLKHLADGYVDLTGSCIK